MSEVTIKNIDEELRIIRDKLIKLTLETMKKQPKDFKNCPNFILRDSIFYRLSSVRFHLNLFIGTHNNILKIIAQKFPHSDDDNDILRSGQEQMLFIFDDIVFGLCSLLDYFGNMIGLLYLGEGKAKIKWNGCCDSCRDKNNHLSSYSIAQYLIKQDRLWVNHLYQYRSRLIHNKRDNAGAKKVISFNQEGISIKFQVDKPEMFLNIIKEYSKGSDIEDQNIVDIATWLIQKCLRINQEMLDIMRKDLVEGADVLSASE